MSTGAAAVLAWSGALATTIAGLGLVGSGMLGHARAATAADLASLAAADTVAVGGADPCAVAAQVAARNDAALTSCAVRGRDVLVTVTVPVEPIGAVGARSRAGPSPAAGP